MEYNEIVENIEKILSNTKFAVLATSNNEGVVSACQMCIISDGLKVYFQTDKTFEKVQNIRENPNVAINIGKYYFKGIANLIGHPTENSDFINMIKEKHPETYAHYTNLPNEVLIEVELIECKIWGVENTIDIHNEDVIQILDLKNKTKRHIICGKL